MRIGCWAVPSPHSGACVLLPGRSTEFFSAAKELHCSLLVYSAPLVVAAAAAATTKGLTPEPHTCEARVLLSAFSFDFVFVQRNLGL